MSDLTQRFGRRTMRMLGTIIVFGLLTLGAFMVGIPQPVHAAEFRGAETVVIGADEVIDDDLFVSGQTVTVDGTVNGNVFATAADVTINGTVNGSVFMTGRTLVANGAINGSLYSSGYALRLGPEATIAHSIYFGGFSLTTERGSQVGRSLNSGGYQLILNGDVADNVNVGAGALELNGTVGGDVTGEVGSAEGETPTDFMPTFEGQVPAVPPGLRVGDSAQVAGDIAVETTVLEETPPAPFYSPANQRTRRVIGELIALLIIGALLLWWRPDGLRRAGEMVRESPLPSFGVGLLAVIAVIFLVPLAVAIIAMLAIVGGLISYGQLVAPFLGLGLTGLVFVVAVFAFLAGMVSKIIVALLGGRLLVQQEAEDGISAMEFVALAIGLLVYAVLRVLPFGIGAIIAAIVSLLGIGALFLAQRRTLQTRDVAVTAPVVGDDEVPL